MSELLNALGSPESMSQEQWLILAIGFFIVLGSLYFILRLYRLFKGMGKSTYTPNIGLSRVEYKNQSVSQAQPTAQFDVSDKEEAKSE